MFLNCVAVEDSWESAPWTSRRSNQSVLKEINPEYSFEGPMLKLQYFATRCEDQFIVRDLDAGKHWKRKEKRVAIDEIFDSIRDAMNMSLSKFQMIEKDRGASPASVHGVANSWIHSNWTTKKTKCMNTYRYTQIFLERCIPKWWPNYVWEGNRFLTSETDLSWKWTFCFHSRISKVNSFYN